MDVVQALASNLRISDRAPRQPEFFAFLRTRPDLFAGLCERYDSIAVAVHLRYD